METALFTLCIAKSEAVYSSKCSKRKDYHMANTKVYSFRFSENTLNQIDYLLEDDRKIAWNDRRKAKNRLEIVEDAINEKYLRRVNQIQGNELKDQIGNIISKEMEEQLREIKQQMDEVLYFTIKNDYGNKLLYRSPGIIPPPPYMDDAIEIIVDEESGWNNALEEYMYTVWDKKKLKKYHQK